MKDIKPTEIKNNATHNTKTPKKQKKEWIKAKNVMLREIIGSNKEIV